MKCGKGMGVHKLILGALLLLNAFVWPKWLGIDGWVSFVALLMVIFGFLMLVWPKHGNCSSSCCPPSMPAKPARKPAKRRKKR